jgi:hypothetical protein
MQECIFRDLRRQGNTSFCECATTAAASIPKCCAHFRTLFTTKFTGRGWGWPQPPASSTTMAAPFGVHSTLGEAPNLKFGFQPQTKNRIQDLCCRRGRTGRHSVPARSVVEDEENLRQLAVRVLERQGHTAIAAADGVEGLDLPAEPRQTGHRVCRCAHAAHGRNCHGAKIREEFPDLPIL